MRIFGIQSDGAFNEYTRMPFEANHEEKTLESWLESNPDGIFGDRKILIIGRQVFTGSGYIDLLGVDRAGNAVVVELKRDRTPRDTIAQALEYAAFVERLDADQLETIFQSYRRDESLNFAEYYQKYFDLGRVEAAAFNKDQHIVIVGQQIAPNIRETAFSLNAKGVSVTCVEFTLLQAEGGDRLMLQEIVVDGKSSRLVQVSSRPVQVSSRPVQVSSRPVQVSVSSGSVVNEETFLASCDDNGKAVFSRLLEWAKENSMDITWAKKGFSLSVVLGQERVRVCYAYPPTTQGSGQSLYTAFAAHGSVTSKTAVPERVIEGIKKRAIKTGLFTSTRYEVKCQINRRLTSDKVESLLGVCASIAAEIRKYGLKQ